MTATAGDGQTTPFRLVPFWAAVYIYIYICRAQLLHEVTQKGGPVRPRGVRRGVARQIRRENAAMNKYINERWLKNLWLFLISVWAHHHHPLVWRVHMEVGVRLLSIIYLLFIVQCLLLNICCICTAHYLPARTSLMIIVSSLWLIRLRDKWQCS